MFSKADRLRGGAAVHLFVIMLAIGTFGTRPAVADSNGTWRFLDVSPPRRGAPLCTYDPLSDRMFVFGGRYFATVISDAWWLSIRGEPEWNPLGTTTSSPGCASAHAYDPGRQRLVAFGGSLGFGANSSTIWTHSLGGATEWSPQTTSGPVPTARTRASAVYDSARERMVVFGGESAGYHNDVHALEFPLHTWVPIAPAGTAPTPRADQSAIYDPVRDRMIVFGGADDSNASNELWTLSFSPTPQWQRIVPSGPAPSARSGAAVVYDAPRDRMVLFGGSGSGETWALSLPTLTWSLLATGPGPSGRSLAGATLDPEAERMVIFAGESAGTFLNDAWALSLSGAPAWTLLHVGDPGAHTHHPAIRDPDNDRMIVYSSGLFALDLGNANWRKLQPAGTPPAGSYGVSVYDPAAQRMLLYGRAPGSVVLDEVWSLSLSGPLTWTKLATTGVSPGQTNWHWGILDIARNRLLICGGVASPATARVHALSLSTLQWEQLTVAGPNPGNRSGASAIYDPLRDRMVFYGGGNYETWSLSLAGVPTWSKLTTSGTPTDVMNCTEIYDSLRDRMVLFGGQITNYQDNRIYAMNLSGPPTWTELTPAGAVLQGRSGAAGIYDPVRDRMIVHGGNFDGGVITHFTLGDAWELVWGDVAAVPIPSRSGVGHIQLVRPNPGRGRQTFEIELAAATSASSFEIFSITGQRVWSLPLRNSGPGRHTIDWNGAGADGRPMAPGVYLARLRAGTSISSRRFVRIE